MPNKNIIKFGLIALGLSILIFLIFIFRGKKDDQSQVEPTPTPKLVEIELSKRPHISLIPRADGHELKLIIDSITDEIRSIEYELIYNAQDEGLDIEKGLSGMVDVDSDTIEKDLLLGTASCTNGCKYKYDEGINGGSLHIAFTTKNNQIALYDTDFVLSNTPQVKKDGLTLGDFILEASPSQNEFFLLLKNYNNNYSVFSSGTGKGKVLSISPGFSSQDETKIATEYFNE